MVGYFCFQLNDLHLIQINLLQQMLECINQIQISVNQRFDHLAILIIDSQQLSQLLKEEDKKKTVVRNFRTIKSAQKIRIASELKFLRQLEKTGRNPSKAQIISCEKMFANCMNQYLNTEYQIKKTGDPNDLIDIFIFYYEHINAKTKVKQLTVIKNCNFFYEVNFLHQNLKFFLENMQLSMNHVYQNQKSKFFSYMKCENRVFSPQKRQEVQQQKFDTTGKISTKQKRKMQQYCFQLSKLLDLESIYVNYFYFNSIDTEKRKKTLMSNFLKRNVHIKRIIDFYSQQFRNTKNKQDK